MLTSNLLDIIDDIDYSNCCILIDRINSMGWSICPDLGYWVWAEWGECYAPCQSYQGPGFGSGWAWGSDRCGFSEWFTVLTRLSCLGFSCGGGLVARSNGERSRVARRL